MLPEIPVSFLPIYLFFVGIMHKRSFEHPEIWRILVNVGVYLSSLFCFILLRLYRVWIKSKQENHKILFLREIDRQLKIVSWQTKQFKFPKEVASFNYNLIMESKHFTPHKKTHFTKRTLLFQLTTK